jgi:hypothetical protein
MNWQFAYILACEHTSSTKKTESEKEREQKTEAESTQRDKVKLFSLSFPRHQQQASSERQHRLDGSDIL